MSRRTRDLRWCALAALALTAGCLDPVEPDVGEPLRPVCVDEDSDPETPVGFAEEIAAALLDRADLACVDCHSGGGDNPIGLHTSGLSLSSYASLRRGGDRSGDDIVLPGRPCESILLQKVGEAPPFGARMPLDGPPFLTVEERQLISDWIAEGANED
jgi:hypothetical protein